MKAYLIMYSQFGIKERLNAIRSFVFLNEEDAIDALEAWQNNAETVRVDGFPVRERDYVFKVIDIHESFPKIETVTQKRIVEK